MSKLYIGDTNNRAKLVTGIYAGDENNIARKVTAVFQGDEDGLAKKIWAGGEISDKYSVLITTYANVPTDDSNPVSIVPNDTLSYTTGYGIEFKDLNAQNPVWTSLIEATKLSFDSEHKINVRVRGTCSTRRDINTSYGPVFKLQAADESDTTYSMSGAAESLIDYASLAEKKFVTAFTGMYSDMFNGCTWLGDLHAFRIGSDSTFADESCAGVANRMFKQCTNLQVGPEINFSKLGGSFCKEMFYGCTSLTKVARADLAHQDRAIGSFACYQMFLDCTSLIEAPFVFAVTAGYQSFSQMYYGCTSLTTAPELPATTLSERCYHAMFYGCTSLTTAPELPATALSERCYDSMFYDCESLTTAPELPATTLSESCYVSMFTNCTSLTTAPDLPALAIPESAYNSMFSGCDSLTTTPTLMAKSISTKGCEMMFYHCDALSTVNSLWFESVGDNGCSQMFAYCKALTNVPIRLPATSLGVNAYNLMFSNCTSLTTAPELPATTLSNGVYRYMFYNCTDLWAPPNTLPATSIPAGAYTGMFSGCKYITYTPEFAPSEVGANACSTMFYGCKSLGYVNFRYYGELAEGCFKSMFGGCTTLTETPMFAPGDGSIPKSAYEGMFSGCTSLATLSEGVFYASEIGESGCKEMFKNCTSLTTTLKLPDVTDIGPSGCASMYYKCTALTTSGNALPRDRSVKYGEDACYSMFYGCTSLEYDVPRIVAYTIDDSAFGSMFYNCALKRLPVIIIDNYSRSDEYDDPPSYVFSNFCYGDTTLFLTSGNLAGVDPNIGAPFIVPLPLTATDLGSSTLLGYRFTDTLRGGVYPGLYAAGSSGHDGLRCDCTCESVIDDYGITMTVHLSLPNGYSGDTYHKIITLILIDSNGSILGYRQGLCEDLIYKGYANFYFLLAGLYGNETALKIVSGETSLENEGTMALVYVDYNPCCDDDGNLTLNQFTGNNI